MKTTLGLSILMFIASFAAAESPEAVYSGGGASFEPLTDSNLIATLEIAPAPKPACPAAIQAAPAQPTHTVPVSGSITLSGSGFVSVPYGQFMMTLEGWTTLTDGSGDFTSNLTNIRLTAVLMRNYDTVTGYVEPSASIAMYRDGQYVGQASVHGAFYVSGPMNGDWADVRGTGRLQGNLTINPIDASVPLKR